MKNRRLFSVLALLTATLWSGCGPQPVTSGAAPDFTLESLDGSSVTLSDLRGQVVVLDFWASWCTPCIERLDHLQHMHEQNADQGLTVLAINIEETQGEVSTFVSDHGYTFAVLLDTDASVSDAYGVAAIPHTVIVDREGEVHYIAGGPDDIENTLQRLLAE